MLRRQDSNLRPSGYEPDELPLLYFAIFNFYDRSGFAVPAKNRKFYLAIYVNNDNWKNFTTALANYFIKLITHLLTNVLLFLIT